MLERFDAARLFAMAELNQLRTQALDLFDRCLAEGNTAPIVAFIERQLAGDPPQIPLLRDFADDLQQRLLSLRAYHYDVRKNVVKTFAEDYGVDIGPLMPPNAIEQYHLIDPKQVLAYAQEHGAALADKDRLLLGKLLEASVAASERLLKDIKLTADLHKLVLDWLEALNNTLGRRFWAEEPPSNPAVH
jgi:hypothetical protein